MNSRRGEVLEQCSSRKKVISSTCMYRVHVTHVEVNGKQRGGTQHKCLHQFYLLDRD